MSRSLPQTIWMRNKMVEIESIITYDAIMSMMLDDKEAHQFHGDTEYHHYNSAKNMYRKEGSKLRRRLEEERKREAEGERQRQVEEDKLAKEIELEERKKEDEKERMRKEVLTELEKEQTSIPFDHLIEEVAFRLVDQVVGEFSIRIKSSLAEAVRRETLSAMGDFRAIKDSITGVGERRKVGIIGPMRRQFEEVVSKLPPEIKSTNDVVFIEKERHRSIPDADLYIIWTKFISHDIQEQIRGKHPGRTVLTHIFNPKSVSMEIINTSLNGHS